MGFLQHRDMAVFEYRIVRVLREYGYNERMTSDIREIELSDCRHMHSRFTEKPVTKFWDVGLEWMRLFLQGVMILGENGYFIWNCLE